MKNSYNEFKRDEDIFEVDSLDDCFDDVSEPLFGFRTQLMLTENEPCDINVDCQVGNSTQTSNDNNDSSKFFRRQTGEEFSSDGAPSCRVFVDPSNSCQK